MADINKVFGSVTKVSEQLLSAVDSLNQISKECVAFSGDISRVVPQNLKVAMDKILAIVEGSDQSSLSSIMDYIDNVPISQLRHQTLTKTVINQEGTAAASQQAANAAASIDTTPNTSGGARSAITQEGTIDLKQFYTEKYAQKKPLSKIKESNELSFDAIVGDHGLGEDYGDIDPLHPDNFGEPVHSTEFAGVYEGEGDASGLYMPDDDPLIDPENEYDDFGEDIEAPTYEGNWREMSADLHPEESSFDDIIFDDREAI